MSKNIEETIEASSKYAQAEMTKDVVNSKIVFADTYEKVLKGSTDTIIKKRLTTLYLTINETSKYIDSLRSEMSKLDDKDLNNVQLIRKMFLTDGIGDRVFNKIKLSYNCAIEVALTDTAKIRLKKAQEVYSPETKKQFFELSSPGGVDMILYGIQSELIKDGTKSLNGYKTN